MLSHVLVKVADLDRAVADYRALGFVVHYASKRHAHIWFTDGPIIELLTTPRKAEWLKRPINLFWGKGSGTRMARWARAGDGFCDVAVLTDEPADAGVPIGKVISWKRDGITFRFAYPRNPQLPFLVTPYDPPRHPAEIVHPNGATGLTRVVMEIHLDDLAEFERLVGDDPTFKYAAGPVTRVIAIELSGLTGDLDPVLLHGIRII
ncbi:VOC family protein [Lentzea alba]|uniref:VOC family protein n=1 Tax=Lentzea alba TaxID=2714351 RepID=UPI0039BF8AA6